MPGDLIIFDYDDHGHVTSTATMTISSDGMWERDFDRFLTRLVDLDDPPMTAIVIAREDREEGVTTYMVTPFVVGWSFFNDLPWALEEALDPVHPTQEVYLPGEEA